MDDWIVFIHVLAAFTFILVHGASAKVILKLRKEKNPDRSIALLDLSSDYITILYVSLLVLLVAGITSGFLGEFWEEIWIWVALILLIGSVLVKKSLLAQIQTCAPT
jgi:amino acid transporter